jgi:hypothetical protein
MTTLALRKKVHQIVDVDDTDVLEVVYKILQLRKEDNAAESLLTKEQKAELDKTLAEHKGGKLKYYTLGEAKYNFVSS